MHGGGAHTAGRIYTEQQLQLLGIRRCDDWAEVGAALDESRLAFIPLGARMPVLQRMIDMRNLLGLRSPIHSLARLLNPLGARCGLQSIFHPGYQDTHRRQHPARRPRHRHQGRRRRGRDESDNISHLYGTTGGLPWDEEWPALSERRHVKPAQLDPRHLLAVWEGREEDAYGELAVIATMALALRGLGARGRGFRAGA